MDIAKLFEDLQVRAQEAARGIDLDAKVLDARAVAQKVKTRLETDETARNLTIGGGVLLAAMLASRGGRRLVGGAARTGIVAGLGALAYKAWQDRNQTTAGEAEPIDVAPETLAGTGYQTEAVADPAFSRAIIHAMAAAAYADGVIDPEERAAIDSVGETDDADLQALIDGSLGPEKSIDLIALAAETPNHAAQLYTAAVVATGRRSAAESNFLNALRGRLGISETHAAAIAREVAR